MEDSDEDLGPVYDFTPTGVEAQHGCTKSRCDGWAAYTRWLMQLKSEQRRAAKTSCVAGSPVRSTDKLGVLQGQRR